MKKWIIILIIGIVVAGGIGAYALTRRNGANNTSNKQAVASTTTTEETSISSLLTSGKAAKCTYNVTISGGKSVGVAYFSGDKNMYGEFTNSANNTSSTAYVIRNGNTQYVWQKGSTKGYKADVSAYTKEKQQQKSQQFDPSKKYQFSCTAWEVDQTKFTPPSKVTFTDFSATLNKVQEQSGALKSSLCNAITNAEAKAACQKASGQQ